MKKKYLYLLLIVFLLAIAAILVLRDRNSTWSKTYTDFAINDTASVYRVFLADKNGHSSDLQRQEDGTWTVNDTYRAFDDGIRLLLESMMKVSVQKAVPKSAFNNVVSRMAAIGIKVEVYQHAPRIRLFGRGFFYSDRRTKVYYVGDATQDNRGTYMLLEGSDRPFIMYIPGFRGFLTPRYSPKPEDWRTHEIFRYRIPEIARLDISFTEDTLNSFTVINNGDMTFTLEQSATHKVIEAFDTIKVLDLLVSFTDVRFENFLNDMPRAKIDSIISQKPVHIMTVTNVNGGTNTIYTFHKPAPAYVETLEGNLLQYDLDRMYALVNNGADFVLIQYFAFDRIMEPLDYYLTDQDSD